MIRSKESIGKFRRCPQKIKQHKRNNKKRIKVLLRLNLRNNS